MSLKTNIEIVNKKVLWASVIAAFISMTIALVVGFLTSSQVIIFDGVITLVGIGLTYLSVLAIKFIKKKDDWNYPFGKQTFEPFIVMLQYVTILSICITNIITAIQVIMTGGKEIDSASGILYGVYATVFTIFVTLYLKSLTKKVSSGIADVEIAQWGFTTLRGVGVLTGFIIAFFLEMTAFADLSMYIDPILTLIITLIFSKVAIKSIMECGKELLQGTPSEAVKSKIIAQIKNVNEKYDYVDEIIRLGKVGSQLILEIDYVVVANSNLDSVTKQDELRNKIADAIEGIPYEKWVNINFTADAEWVDHICSASE